MIEGNDRAGRHVVSSVFMLMFVYDHSSRFIKFSFDLVLLPKHHVLGELILSDL